MRIAILAVGSQGDVRPSAALGAGLAAAGHEVRLATLGAFRGLATSCGLDFAPVDIDPFEFIRGDIGQSWMDSMDKPHRLIIGVSRAAGELMERLNNDALAACRGYDALLYNVPLSISGHTIAEALGIPGIPTAVAPYHATRAFPSIITPSLPLQGGAVNWLSGAAALQVLWMMFRSHMNRWRRTRPDLARLPLRNPLRAMTRQGVPWLYGFSPSVIPAPADWPESAAVCGYWFTAPDESWRPSEALVDFLRSGPAPIYVGFGSMVGSNPERTLETVLQAIRLAGVRAIFASGWGGMHHAELPEFVFPVESVPHEWLFPQVAAAVHHGGAGTTAAALRAGIPSVVVPYFYDQFFWGQRLHELGVASRPIAQKHLTPDSLADAIRSVVGSPEVGTRSREIAGRIAKERGVEVAVELVERYLGAMMRRITQ
jgi:UDP:flavonoid glycosyltransferase YjiC (YdhE family)